MRMIKRDVFEYFKKEPDVMQVKDVVRRLVVTYQPDQPQTVG